MSTLCILVLTLRRMRLNRLPCGEKCHLLTLLTQEEGKENTEEHIGAKMQPCFTVLLFGN